MLFAEPAFSRSTTWPPPGFHGLPPEPEDPGPVIERDTLLVTPSVPAVEWSAGSATLDRPADEPLQATIPAAPARKQAWKAAVLVSCLLHAAAAMAFLTGAVDRIETAGSDQADVTLLGDASDDRSSAGDGIEAANVIVVTMLGPQPPATAGTVAETARAQPVEAIAENTPSRSVPGRMTGTADPIPRLPPSDTTESVAAPPDPMPGVPTAQEPSARAVTARTEGAPIPSSRPAVEARSAETVRSKKRTEVEPAKKPPPEKRPGKSEKRAAAKDNPVPKAERTAKEKKAAGSGGTNQTDSRRGAADGQADGRKAVAGKGGSASTAGNAAASNYPGKVATKLRRAVRGISRSTPPGAGSDVLVSFTVNASGGLGGVRIARSSGSPELDKAALAIVRRAAPFPPIPAETGRRNWAFTLPLGMR